MSDTQGVAEAIGWNPPGGGTQLTCGPWADLDDLPDGCPCHTVESGGDLPSDAELIELIDDATDALFVLLGRPAIGVCELTVYPCANTVIPFLGPRHPSVLGYSGMPCSDCGHEFDVWLDGPVHDVLAVVIDGETLDPSEYHLEDGVWLVRREGSWPAGGDPDDDLFSITYERGVPTSKLIRGAIAEIVNEMWMDQCGNREQKFTAAIRSMSTGGTQYSYEDVASALPKMPQTRMAIAQWNPSNQAVQPFAYSPDMGYRTKVIRTFT